MKVTSNKRHVIYDSNGKFVNTKPFELRDGKLIKTDSNILFTKRVVIEVRGYFKVKFSNNTFRSISSMQILQWGVNILNRIELYKQN